MKRRTGIVTKSVYHYSNGIRGISSRTDAVAMLDETDRGCTPVSKSGGASQRIIGFDNIRSCGVFLMGPGQSY